MIKLSLWVQYAISIVLHWLVQVLHPWSATVCINCLQPGHFVKQCTSLHHCRKCQKPHHTLLHVEQSGIVPATHPPSGPTSGSVSANAASEMAPGPLLMTCRVVVSNSTGSSVECRALLDSASSASFVTERLAWFLCLRCFYRKAKIFGVAGLSHTSPTQPFAKFVVSSLQEPTYTRSGDVTAVTLQKRICKNDKIILSYEIHYRNKNTFAKFTKYFCKLYKLFVQSTYI